MAMRKVCPKLGALAARLSNNAVATTSRIVLPVIGHLAFPLWRRTGPLAHEGKCNLHAENFCADVSAGAGPVELLVPIVLFDKADPGADFALR